MKIGLSYSRCLRDIVDGTVDIDDVLVVISRTDFDPHDNEQWDEIWNGYHAAGSWSKPEWAGYPSSEFKNQFRAASIQLWEQGKFHQPRQFGARPNRLPYYWLDVIVSPTDINSAPALKEAYEHFLTVAGLFNVNAAQLEHRE